MPSLRPTPSRSRLAAVGALAMLAACPGADPDPIVVDAPRDFDCGDRLVAEVRAPGVGYRPLAEAAAGAELILGFQGFRYAYLRARLDVTPPVVSAAVVVQLDGEAARSQPVQLSFAADGAGVVSAPMQIFFNDDPLPSLVDHGVGLQLLLGTRCAAAGHSVLRYDPSCYEGPDGHPVCDVGDGAPDGGL